jgi:phospholipid/cholesterol/gamma-HCH transport system substrate-binding protein
MSAKSNYFKVGVFVLATVGLIIAGIIWLSAGALKEEQILMETYIAESVQGLSKGSPVKRSGVQIGRVEEITFVNKQYAHTDAAKSDMVMIIMSTDKSHFPPMTPMELRARVAEQVARGLRVKMASQGITGIAYIEAEFADPKRYPLPKIQWTPTHLYVPSIPSTITSFTQSLDRILVALERIDYAGITTELKETVKELHKVLAEAKVGEVRKEFVGLITDLKRTSRLMMAVIDKTQGGPGVKIKTDAADVLTSLDKATKSVQSLVDKSTADLKTANIPEAIAQLNKTVKRLEQLARGQQGDVDVILANLRRVSENLMKLSESAKQYPSQVLFGSAPPRKEEKK